MDGRQRMSFIVPSRHLGLLLLHPIGNGLSSRISHKIVIHTPWLHYFLLGFSLAFLLSSQFVSRLAGQLFGPVGMPLCFDQVVLLSLTFFLLCYPIAMFDLLGS